MNARRRSCGEKDFTPVGYRAMNEREAIKVMVKP
jgi:hypothetical protein